jgi:TonB dependent receptor/TonB-dependent Receptor Plug Domain
VGSLEEIITVAAEAPIVDLTSKEVGGNISTRELASLPTINRNFMGFLALTPGVITNVSTESIGSDSIVTNGREGRNNNFLLDGANNFDDVNGGRSGTQARVPIDSIQELQVITNQFDAEFGRSSGAVVNAITKSGTNQFHGTAFGYLQDESMTQNEFFAKRQGLSKPESRELQVGGSLGGPILRNRAHFFVNLERYIQDRGQTINIPSRPEFNTTTATESRVWNSVIRVDHQINANNTWGVRWLRETSPAVNQIVDVRTLAAGESENDLDQTVVGSFTSVLKNTQVNTLRLTFTQEDVVFGNPGFTDKDSNQALLPATLAYQNFTDQQSARAQWRTNNAYQIEDTYSWFLPGKGGDHDLKFGAQYQYSTADNFNDGNANGTYSFGRSNAAFNPADPRTYPDRFSIRVGGPNRFLQKVHFATAFAQDKWKMTDRLTLNLGLRYDVEIVPIDETDNPTFASPSDYPVDADNWQPRVGVAYALGADRRSVLRGGIGKFYERTYFELVGGFYTGAAFSSSQIRNYPLNNADLNPRNGLFPTTPELINGPAPVDHARFEAEFPPGTRFPNTGATWDHPNRQIPYAYHATAGYERQLGRDASFAVDYVHTFSRDLLIFRELNPTLRATTNVNTSASVRQGSAELTRLTDILRQTYPGFTYTASVQIPENVGKVDYDSLQFQLDKRFSSSYAARVAYTVSYARGNTRANGIPQSPFQVLDDLNLEANEGPTVEDRTHNLTVSGVFAVPKTGGLTVSGVARALSGLPITITNGNVDPDRNGTQAEPVEAGTYRGAGDLPYEVDFDGTIGGARGPWFFKLDMRVGYVFRFGNKSIEPFAEIFNVTNRANFGMPTNFGNQADPQFLNFTQTLVGNSNPRLVQVAARFTF